MTDTRQNAKDRVYAAVTREAVPMHVIAKKTGISLATTSKYLFVLQAENKVIIQNFGNMKLAKRKS
jgi:predicted Rossmann fold nucleotide-binding protein DprA/Smf involved in DNA uptake